MTPQDSAPRYRICKWDNHQHYPDRDPPWIKLHRRLLTSYRYTSLSDAGKGHYCGLLMLAAGDDGHFIGDCDYLAHILHATDPIDLAALVSVGLIEYVSGSVHDASTALALSRVEKIRKDKKRKETPSPVEEVIDVVNGHRRAVGMTVIRGDVNGKRYVNARIADTDVETVLRVAKYAPTDPWIADGMKLTLQAIFSPRSFPALLDRMENPRPNISEGDRKVIAMRQYLDTVPLGGAR